MITLKNASLLSLLVVRLRLHSDSFAASWYLFKGWKGQKPWKEGEGVPGGHIEEVCRENLWPLEILSADFLVSWSVTKASCYVGPPKLQAGGLVKFHICLDRCSGLLCQEPTMAWQFSDLRGKKMELFLIKKKLWPLNIGSLFKHGSTIEISYDQIPRCKVFTERRSLR